MEIEKKYLIDRAVLPEGWEQCETLQIEQAYLCTDPVVRIRRQDDDYFLTYKGRGLMVREEVDLPLTREAYLHLREKADGNIIAKCRTLIPYGKYTIELDIFAAPFRGLILAEVEFETEEEALAFEPPAWFGQDVTLDGEYQNSFLSRKKYT